MADIEYNDSGIKEEDVIVFPDNYISVNSARCMSRNVNRKCKTY